MSKSKRSRRPFTSRCKKTEFCDNYFLILKFLNSAAKIRKNPDSHQMIIGISMQKILFLTYPRRRNNKRYARERTRTTTSL